MNRLDAETIQQRMTEDLEPIIERVRARRRGIMRRRIWWGLGFLAAVAVLLAAVAWQSRYVYEGIGPSMTLRYDTWTNQTCMYLAGGVWGNCSPGH